MNQADPGVRDHAPPGTERLLAGLTPEQAQAVTFGSGPLLLLAGPGAGKTRTLTHRAAYLLASGRAKPWEILAVTFSVRAAGELRLRLADLLGETVARGGDRGDVPLGVRAAAARARERVRAHRALHDLRPGGHAPRGRLAALRRRARRDPAGAGRLRAAGERRGARRDLARQELAADPGRLRALRHASGRAADRRGVARERARAAALQRVRVRRPARVRGQAARRASAPARVAAAAVALDRWPTSSRTPATRRRRSSTCSPARTGTCACAAMTTS